MDGRYCLNKARQNIRLKFTWLVPKRSGTCWVGYGSKRLSFNSHRRGVDRWVAAEVGGTENATKFVVRWKKTKKMCHLT